jgi:hypothetical protein
MAFGVLYPKYRAAQTYHDDFDHLKAVVKTALVELQWPYKLEWGKDFVAEIPRSAFSYRHEIRVTISEHGEITAESKSMDREMFFDCGRNKTRVDRFFAKIDEVISRHH